jgi:hypothetical protein
MQYLQAGSSPKGQRGRSGSDDLVQRNSNAKLEMGGQIYVQENPFDPRRPPSQNVPHIPQRQTQVQQMQYLDNQYVNEAYNQGNNVIMRAFTQVFKNNTS